MAERVTCTGSFELPVNPADAIGLFTAEGERRWIPGWVPEYPEAGAEHDAAGTVFIRRDHGGPQTFIVVENGPLLRRYARVTDNVTAGTIEVTCESAGEGTLVRVAFDLTALSPEGAAWLDAFASGYDGMMTLWRDWITASELPLAARQPAPLASAHG
jgi:hypothetical protein